MSRLAIIPMLLLALGGEHERGLQLYREGKFAEAAAAFRAAIAQDGDSAALQWNLARACFAAGEFEAAEVAAEKYAALAKDARADLHLGMLGAVRHAQAKTLAAAAETPPPPPPPAAAPQGNAAPAAAAPADPLPQLEQALQKAKDAGDYYERAVQAQPAPELLRNLERSQRLQQALAARIDELKKQREQQQSEDKEKDPQQKDQGDKKPDEKNKDDEKKPADKKDDDKQQDDEQQDEKKSDEQKGESQKQDGKDKKDEKPQTSEPEPKDEAEQKKPGEEPKPQDGKPEPQQGAGGKSEQPPEPQGNGGEQPQPDEEQKGQQPPESAKDGKDGASAPWGGDKPEDGKVAAGEPKPAAELTPEQKQQLLERLQKLDERRRAARLRARSGRPPVERDW